MQKIFDSHFHIVDPEFPLVENNGFIPDFYTVDEYLQELKELQLEPIGGAVVSGSFQGFHQEYFEDALSKLGDQFVGVTQIPCDTNDKELERLHSIGIRAIRFNLYRGLETSLSEIEALSTRVFEGLGWSTEFYLNLGEVSAELDALMQRLPKISIDHLGMGRGSLPALKKYLSQGVPVRMTGFGRVEFTEEDLREILPKLYKENPDGLLFGTDLPSTRARYRFGKDDLSLIKEIFNTEELNKVFYENGYSWYLEK